MSVEIEQSHTQPPGVPLPLPSSLEYARPHIQREAATTDQNIAPYTAMLALTILHHINEETEPPHTQPPGAPLPLPSSLEDVIHRIQIAAASAYHVSIPVQHRPGPQPDICVVMAARGPVDGRGSNTGRIRFGMFPVSKVGGIEKIVKLEKIVEEENAFNPEWAHVVQKKPSGETIQPQKETLTRVRGKLGGSPTKGDEAKTWSVVRPKKRDLAKTVRAWRDEVNKVWNAEGWEWNG
jgi:hypothetical protein